MKQLTFSTILCVLILLSAGCDLKRKQRLFSNDIDTVLAQKLDSANKALEAQYAREIEMIKETYQQKIDDLEEQCKEDNSMKGKYFIIVGAFKTPAYAEKYAEKISKLGYSTQVIDYKGGFKLVAAGSANSLLNAKAQLKLLRENVAVGSWIYVN